jgi:hypothetical protein
MWDASLSGEEIAAVASIVWLRIFGVDAGARGISRGACLKCSLLGVRRTRFGVAESGDQDVHGRVFPDVGPSQAGFGPGGSGEPPARPVPASAS